MLHLICRGNNRTRVFRNAKDFREIWRLLCKCSDETGIRIHHYVLMHTHLHLLAWFDDTAEVAPLMKSVMLTYHYYYRRRYGGRGHLWHSRYRSVIIHDEPQWLHCGRYIELNPVHAHMCSDPRKYRWSSYHYYAHGKRDDLLRPTMHPGGLPLHERGKDNEGYREFVLAGIDVDYHRLKKQFEFGRVQETEQDELRNSEIR
jgi:putative transposase